ncbi:MULTISPECIES: HlyD family type I secretion periplasmic adaptor subunit [Novacetimonas]|uniref:Membrane fusion protein (MFP) family protein n=1 Tax=Novacetimonas hansenii TaxID=436 RepID=A0AAW5EPX3_NOVHA|nr:HlyD family type I secretion periplasmic adaptor subunit [Novacetimonas hansenii]MBL7236322.1 HlyD family type I secretion periplasmic adaptor subunit [Novacetimonas hansenii]MCJ8353822.1 HlyD family type I secretion periplasmic adaptor subunit [Novacetimonas hansenii]RFP05565.1 multidrug ABC transporter [Novacetimonas hansenii]WEQ57941.1 HlyD family type I secretion periplasmic adaptor subunit [Novacetimonas hansenii]CUW46143.1 Hemolysin secretion protein D, plasmid [Novacetimonas hansenii
MSERDMTPHDASAPDGGTHGATGADTGRRLARLLPRADNDTTPAMPPGLLEFYSPSAALIDMPPQDAALYIIWVIGGLAIAGLLVMTFLPLDRVVMTNGRLVAADGTLVVQPLETSIIRSIDVHEGDIVHKGDVLAQLDPTISDADVENMRKQAASYRAEVARLTAEAAGHDYAPDMSDPASIQEAADFMRRRSEYSAKVANYDRQIVGLQSDLQGYEASTAMYAARAKVASDVRDMRVRLQHEQVGSRLSTLASQDSLMEVVRSQITARHDADATRARLDAMKAQRDGYIGNWQATIYQDLSVAQHHLADADSSYRKAMLHHTLVQMRAEKDAVVLSIARLSTGSVLQAASPLMTLVPVDGRLEVESVMRGLDVGYVRPGDRALLKFSAFPYTQYGGADATVRVISADSFVGGGNSAGGMTAQEGGAPDVTGDPQSAYYRVRLAIDRYTLHGVPPFFRPQPGMPVEADIHVGRRTIMQYLLNKLVPAMTDGMREP